MCPRCSGFVTARFQPELYAEEAFCVNCGWIDTGILQFQAPGLRGVRKNAHGMARMKDAG